MMRVSSYVVGAQIPGQSFHVLLHGLTGALDKVSSSVAERLLQERGAECASSFPGEIGEDLFKHLRARGYITDLAHEEERNALVGIAKALHQTDLAMTPTNFMLIPTYRCNLRCPYCFQSHDLHAGKGRFSAIISEEMVDHAFAAMDRLRGRGAAPRAAGFVDAPIPDEHRPSRRIGLFGGEPLSAGTLPIVHYISRRAAERGDRLSATTNGVQLDLFEDLLGQGPGGIEELQITLDGPRQAHDRRRVGPGFPATFERIADNIDLALFRGSETAVRLNIDSNNPYAVEELDSFFESRGWTGHPLFMAYAAVVHDTAPRDAKARSELVEDAGAPAVRKHPKPYKPGSLDEASLAALTAELKSRPQGSSISSYERYARDLVRACLSGESYPFKQGGHCSAEVGLLMFDPFGDIYACWEEAGHRNRRIATYDAEGVRFDSAIAAQWYRRFPGAIEQCSECPYALVHTSGCGKHAIDTAGTTFAAACESFQSYFPPTLAEAYRQAELQILGPVPELAAAE